MVLLCYKTQPTKSTAFVKWSRKHWLMRANNFPHVLRVLLTLETIKKREKGGAEGGDVIPLSLHLLP